MTFTYLGDVDESIRDAWANLGSAEKRVVTLAKKTVAAQDSLAQIAEYKGKVTALKAEVEHYNKLIAPGTAHTCLDSAIQNLTDFAATWVTLGHSLRSTMDALGRGGKETASALMEMDLDAAEENWTGAKECAKKFQDVPSDIKVVPADKAA